MSILYIILIILGWLIVGLLCSMCIYYTAKKDWYYIYNTNRIFKNSELIQDLNILKFVFIICGPISVIIILLMILVIPLKSFTLYFKTPKK